MECVRQKGQLVPRSCDRSWASQRSGQEAGVMGSVGSRGGLPPLTRRPAGSAVVQRPGHRGLAKLGGAFASHSKSGRKPLESLEQERDLL